MAADPVRVVDMTAEAEAILDSCEALALGVGIAMMFAFANAPNIGRSIWSTHCKHAACRRALSAASLLLANARHVTSALLHGAPSW